jgi:hypothetical protein
MRVETSRTYFERKYRELAQLNDCLATPLQLPTPRAIDEVIEEKFRLAALLKA